MLLHDSIVHTDFIFLPLELLFVQVNNAKGIQHI